MPLSAAGMGIVRHCPASPISVPKRALDGTFQSPDIIINFGYMKYWEIRLSLTHHYKICILTCPETAGFSPETSRSYVPHSNFNFQYRPVFVPIDLNVTIKVIKRNHLINQMNLFFFNEFTKSQGIFLALSQQTKVSVRKSVGWQVGFPLNPPFHLKSVISVSYSLKKLYNSRRKSQSFYFFKNLLNGTSWSEAGSWECWAEETLATTDTQGKNRIGQARFSFKFSLKTLSFESISQVLYRES